MFSLVYILTPLPFFFGAMLGNSDSQKRKSDSLTPNSWATSPME